MSQRAMDRLVAELSVHLCEYFPDAVALYQSPEREQLIRQALTRANTLGLRARQDLYRFINLHAFLGWEFLDLAESAWMRAWLANPTRGAPGARLLSLQQQIVFNMERQARA
ncbi:hypothetical protein RugamoR64_48650 [Duganella rhizosphaerae]